MQPEKPLRVISLGWGVQSFALACMSALGVLPKVDAAVHGDTGWERPETYRLAEKWTPWLESRGIRVVTAKASDKVRFDFQDPNATYKGYSPPFFVVGPRGTGRIGRHCTDNWKRKPVTRWLSSELHRRGLKKTEGIVDLWLGITLDEITRMRVSPVKYINHVFPLVQDLERPWTRQQTIDWLIEHNLEVPVKSSCVFCPYRDRATWRDIQLNSPECWKQAVEVDAQIRHMKEEYACYVSRQGKPLPECDFRSAEDVGQMLMWEDEECSGTCFL
jgi:hypothetical protein